MPIAARKINHYGVTIGRLTYDGEVLNYYRGLPNPDGGRFVNKWPIRLDPRDLSRAYFKDPEDDTWHQLPWVHAPSPYRPFNDRFLMHAKALLAARQGRAYGDSQELGEVVAEIFKRIERGGMLDAKERVAVARAAIQADQASRDRGVNPSPTLSEVEEDANRTNGETNGYHDVQDLVQDPEPSGVEPYPVWGDEGYEDYLPGEGVDS